MDDLVKVVVKNTGLVVETAEQAVDVVIHYLEQRLPDPFPELIEKVLDGVNLRDQKAEQKQTSGEVIVPTIHLSGMSVPEFVDAMENKKELVRCFICKRQEGAESVVFNDQGEPGQMPVVIFRHKKRCGDVVFTWPLCRECVWLLGFFSAN